MLGILLSLKIMESLENGLQPQSGATPLFPMKAVLLVTLGVNGPLPFVSLSLSVNRPLASYTILDFDITTRHIRVYSHQAEMRFLHNR